MKNYRNQLKLRKFVKNHQSLIFHKKKLELGRIQFVTDDLYFNGIKIKSGFRPVLINQPGADSERSRFKSQLDKFTIKRDYYSIATLFILVILFYTYYLKPLCMKIHDLIYGESLSDESVSNLINFLGPVLGIDDDDGLLLAVFTQCTTYFTLLPF